MELAKHLEKSPLSEQNLRIYIHYHSYLLYWFCTLVPSEQLTFFAFLMKKVPHFVITTFLAARAEAQWYIFITRATALRTITKAINIEIKKLCAFYVLYSYIGNRVGEDANWSVILINMQQSRQCGFISNKPSRLCFCDSHLVVVVVSRSPIIVFTNFAPKSSAAFLFMN